ARGGERGGGERRGVDGASPPLPVIAAGAPNGGFPDGQLPVRTAAEIAPAVLPVLDRAEIARHSTVDSLWVVIAGEVYDLTGWAPLHPGGRDVPLGGAGPEAAPAFPRAGHPAARRAVRPHHPRRG